MADCTVLAQSGALQIHVNNCVWGRLLSSKQHVSNTIHSTGTEFSHPSCSRSLFLVTFSVKHSHFLSTVFPNIKNNQRNLPPTPSNVQLFCVCKKWADGAAGEHFNTCSAGHKTKKKGCPFESLFLGFNVFHMDTGLLHLLHREATMSRLDKLHLLNIWQTTGVDYNMTNAQKLFKTDAKWDYSF